jgi:signal transduction histidine kinase/CheY-like chemotaxis protein
MMPSQLRSVALRYGSAVVSIALAMLVRLWLEPVLNGHYTFTLFYAALIFTAWYGGKGPSLLAILLGLLAGILLTALSPHGRANITSEEYIIGIALYCLIGLLSVFFSESLRLARERAEVNAADALRRQEQLECEVAQRKRLEEALRQRAAELAEAHRRKDEFLAMLAHELRNPLAPVRSGLHIIKQLGISGTPLEKVQQIMERQVELLIHLVDDLLDLSRIAHGKIHLHKQKIHLATVVHSAVETCRPLIEARRHELTVTLPDEPLHLEADPTRLEQILINLLSNAAKYTQEGGRIELTAGQQKDEVVIRVRDNGMGIPPEMLRRIFEPFQQADWVGGHADVGLGVGLTLVRRLTELHNGRVAVHSPGPGQGSEFVVRLPALPAQEAKEHPRGPIETVTVPPKRRVLIVDDNEDVAKTLAMMLRLQGHEVRVAANGPDALAIARVERPNLVLLDLAMPGMDGYEVARQLRRQPGLENVVLAALTGWARDDDRQRTLSAGFDEHLIKPVEPAQLQQLLDRLDRRQPAPANGP